MECNKCLQGIDKKNERYTICEGVCAKRYHISCVGISEETMRALFTKNVLWMCDECLVDFCAKRDVRIDTDTEIDDSSHPATIASDVADLKTKVEAIIDTLTALEARTQQFHQLPHEKRHSTPVMPSVFANSLLDGTRVHEEDADVEGISSEGNESFALYLTNIECNTNEDHVAQLVRSSLVITDTEKIKVRKLVPRGKTCDELDYISFKVILDIEWKSLALKPSTWPIGIKFREFENRNIAWKPSQ